MFYSHSLLSKKGPLGTIWIAAHCFKKLKKDQIDHIDIPSSVDKIMPEIQISYRILAQLLIGIVRIFSKKVDYLYHDCNEALTCIIKSVTPGKCTVTKGVMARRQHRSMEAKGHRQHNNIGSPKEPDFAGPVEIMRAPHHHVNITVPEILALDSFDLEVPDHDDAANIRPQEESIIQDHWLDGNNNPSFLDECNHRESVVLDEINSTCFTPVKDVLPSFMMDIDLEFHEEYNLRNGEAREDNLQGDTRCNGESEDKLYPVQMMEAIDSGIVENVKNLLEPLVSHEPCSSDCKISPNSINEDTIATRPTKTLGEDPLSCDLGVPSPKFTVRTPAKREHRRILKKRKQFFDETVVLSNETLRKGIHDASSLVTKRRKAPHTFLDIWKYNKISHLHLDFSEPLIPFMALELKALFQRSNYLESEDVENHTSTKSTEVEHSYHEIVVEVSSPKIHTETPRTDKSSEMEIKNLSSLELSDIGVDFMDQEIEAQEKDAAGQDNGWSSRTRAVAWYLYSKILDIKGAEQKGCLSLHQILQGSKRSDCARFLYEILILKGHQSIEVNQDSPCGEIIISPTPKLEAVFKS